MKGFLLGCAGVVLAAGALPAAADPLSTGTGDGQVTIEVDAFGHIANGGAIYNPVGEGAAASTIYNSTVLYRVGSTGARADLVDAGSVVSFGGTTTARVSVFTLDGFSVALTQAVAGLFDADNVQTGSQLTQSYAFTNLGGEAVTLDLARYLDGDLLFDGSLTDGGGVLFANGAPLLFEIDSATGASAASTFLGLYNTGGEQNGYQVQTYNVLYNALRAGGALDGSVQNDTDPADGFIDAGAGFDVGLGLGSRLPIAAGGTATWTTVTLFGSGAPGRVVIPPAVPEPASWAMMIVGFGMAGGALRRRRTAAVPLRA